MAFQPVDSRQNYSEMEQKIIRFWKEQRIFQRSVEERSEDDAYVFYDGPPFITGVPHYGTLLPSIIKDAVPRYWTMKGKRVERVWGWDCHGLPAENFTEKKLGIQSKQEIFDKVGIKEYIDTCRRLTSEVGDSWEPTIDRIGRWVDFQGAYRTMDRNFMESVWWAFQQLYEKGLIYEGEKVLMYSIDWGTPISKSEVTMDNSYQEVTDPSVYAKFQLVDEEKTFFLAWTTTPWTLPGNMALAVNPELTYVRVAYRDETLIVAKEAVESSLKDEKNQSLEYKVLNELSGTELVGRKYLPFLPKEKLTISSEQTDPFQVLEADFVSAEEGTGIVHMAPAFGEDDYELCKKAGLPFYINIDERGVYTDGPWLGSNILEVNKAIAKQLLSDGKVLRIEYYRHSYPHNPRTGIKLIYKAHPSWFLNVEAIRALMLEKNKEINWFPDHFQHGRFENVMMTAPDWNLSRDRFWATPLPVWRGVREDGTTVEKVFGSFSELEAMTGVQHDDYHRPVVDELTFEQDGVKYEWIGKVMDCWFESGSMPFAQFHYPFENKEKFEANFPGDFITEYVGQVRAWFYYLHAVSIALFDQPSFRNVIVTGTIAGNDGRKMSKSLGNFTDPNVLLEQYSADALRYLFLSSPLMHGEDYALIDKDVADVQRKLLGTLWNSYSFFVLYANLDEWTPEGKIDVSQLDELDRWILSELQLLIGQVDEGMQQYDLCAASRPILGFVDHLSNWYIRRNRKKFWKGELDQEKKAAYHTLWTVLTELAKLMAPLTPFIAEEIYRNITGRDSVHLEGFPEVNTRLIDEKLSQQMKQTRQAVEFGLSLRSQAKMKVRQPLQRVFIDQELGEFFRHLIRDELNVKEVVVGDDASDSIRWREDHGLKVGLDTTLTPELKLEGEMRELVRQIQNLRKNSGLEVEDRIALGYVGGEALFSTFGAEISEEVLSVEIQAGELDHFDGEKTVKLSEGEVRIWIQKK